MRVTQADTLNPELASEARQLGELLSRLRIARGVKQTDAALRAGLSRNTVYRMEKGDPGVAFGQILRYLDVVAPGLSLAQLFTEADPALAALALREKRQRVRSLTAEQLREVDF